MVSQIEKVIIRISAFCFVGVLPAMSSNAINAHNSDIEELFLLINERLSYMEHVALSKERSKAPTEDIARETAVLMESVESANELGLFGPSVESFFRAQISIAKAIQYRYRADWQSESPSFTPLDLQEIIRPKLSQIGRSIIHKVATLYRNGDKISEEHRELFDDCIDADKINQQDKTKLFNSLLVVETQK
tara:strand:+ start:11 stop:583 length:573 start_codon:yes stop_codon:yes gene_type:complete